MGIAELFEIGSFSLLWNWSAPLATALLYSCLCGGAVIQIILQKCQKAAMRWLLIGSCGMAVTICEFVWHFMTGWERLGLVFLYGYILCILLGALMTAATLSVKSKRRQAA